MKNSLRLLSLALATVLSLPSSLHAEVGNPQNKERGKGHGDRLAMMKEKLNLTPEQVEKLKPIFEEIKANKAAMRAARENQKQKMHEMMKASREKIEAVLTPEQLEKWKSQMQKRRQEHGGADKPGGEK